MLVNRDLLRGTIRGPGREVLRGLGAELLGYEGEGPRSW